MRDTICPTTPGTGSTTAQACSFTAIAAGDVGVVTIGGFHSGGAATVSSITSGTLLDTNNDAGGDVAAAGWVGAGTSSITVNFSLATVPVIHITEFSGVNTTTPIDKHIAAGSSVSATTCTNTATAPTQSGDLLVAYVTNTTANNLGALTTSPTTTTAVNGGPDSAEGIESDDGYSVYSGTTAIAPTWTYGAAQNLVCGFVLLNPAASSSKPGITLRGVG